MPKYTPLADPTFKPASTAVPAAPPATDTVSKMKAYLAQSGYTPPPPTASTNTGSWYDSVVTNRNEGTTVGDESFGGFGKVMGDIGESFNKRNTNIAESKKNYQEGNESFGSSVYHAVAQTAGFGNDIIGDVVKSVVKPEVLKSFGEHLAPLVHSAAQTPGGQGILKWWEGLNPATQRTLSDTGEIASLLSNAVGGGVAKDTAGTALTIAKDVAQKGGEQVVAPTVQAIKTGIKDATITPIKDAFPDMKTAAAEGRVPFVEGMSDQAKTSAQRLAPKGPLIGAGAARQSKPLDIYNSFAEQEGKHIADVKQDPAVSLVGERIGDAFDTVVKQRREAGATMAAELEKTAAKAVDTKGALGKFQSELIDNGATFDAKTGEITGGSFSKFSTDDKKILGKYAIELQKLGSKPSMKAVDAFVSRMPKEIEGLKASSGITFQTNAERLVSSNLNELRTALTKTGTKEYGAARTQYSELSKFIDEGARHLGKVTQTGDYAKDASIAKSAVQSVLNNGKKDWLIELENKTGYPAMDEATLALQAMQDAGDYKGESLLKLLTEDAVKGGTPHGAIANAIIGFSKKTVGKALFGTKADQTRAYLKTLGESPKK